MTNNLILKQELDRRLNMAQYANSLLNSITYGNIDEKAKEAIEMKKVTPHPMPENVPADADMGTLD